MYVCVCASSPQAMKNSSYEVKSQQPIKQVLLLFTLLIWHLTIDITDGRGLSNEVHR